MGFADSFQQYFRMANAYGPQAQQSPAMPPERMEAAPYQPEPIQAAPLRERPRPFGRQGPVDRLGSITADSGFEPPERMIPLPPEPDQNSILKDFRQTVLNPPQRTQMTYPASTNAGLDAALKIAAEPSPLKGNRVYVDGQAYQKNKVIVDAEGNKRYISPVAEPAFMDQVMRAMPAAASSAVDILNQPRADAMADQASRIEGLTKGSQAESNAALVGQRNAQARAIPINSDIRRMDAETRQYLASLKDLPESVKQQMLIDGRMDVATYNAQAAYTRQQLAGDQAYGRQALAGSQGIARQQLAGQQQTANITQRGQIQGQLQQSGGLLTSQHIREKADFDAKLAAQRAKDQLALKAAPGWSAANQSEYQQKIGLQGRVAQIVNENPGLAQHIDFDDNGFPVINQAGMDPETYTEVYSSIYGAAPPVISTGGSANMPQVPGQPQGYGGYPAPQPGGYQQPQGQQQPQQPTQQQPQDPNNIPIPPPKVPGVQPTVQYSATTGQYRIDYGDGKGFIPYYPFGKQ